MVYPLSIPAKPGLFSLASGPSCDLIINWWNKNDHCNIRTASLQLYASASFLKQLTEISKNSRRGKNIYSQGNTKQTIESQVHLSLRKYIILHKARKHKKQLECYAVDKLLKKKKTLASVSGKSWKKENRNLDHSKKLKIQGQEDKF